MEKQKSLHDLYTSLQEASDALDNILARSGSEATELTFEQRIIKAASYIDNGDPGAYKYALEEEPGSIKLSNSNFYKIAHGKRTTIRLGEKDYSLGRAMIESLSGDIAEVIITEVRRVRFGNLGLQDAVNDGFNSFRELREELERCYDRFVDDKDPVTLIRFMTL